MEKIEICFKNEENEYVEAMKLFYNHSLKVKFDLILAILMIALGSSMWWIYGYSSSFLFAITVGVGGVGLIIFINYWQPRRIYRQESKFRDEYILIFGEQGIEFRTGGINSIIDWSYYKSVWETDKFYYLFYMKSQFSLIPKRAFKTVEDENAFKKLVSDKFEENLRRIG